MCLCRICYVASAHLRVGAEYRPVQGVNEGDNGHFSGQEMNENENEYAFYDVRITGEGYYVSDALYDVYCEKIDHQAFLRTHQQEQKDANDKWLHFARFKSLNKHVTKTVVEAMLNVNAIRFHLATREETERFYATVRSLRRSQKITGELPASLPSAKVRVKKRPRRFGSVGFQTTRAPEKRLRSAPVSTSDSLSTDLSQATSEGKLEDLNADQDDGFVGFDISSVSSEESTSPENTWARKSHSTEALDRRASSRFRNRSVQSRLSREGGKRSQHRAVDCESPTKHGKSSILPERGTSVSDHVGGSKKMVSTLNPAVLVVDDRTETCLKTRSSQLAPTLTSSKGRRSAFDVLRCPSTNSKLSIAEPLSQKALQADEEKERVERKAALKEAAKRCRPIKKVFSEIGTSKMSTCTAKRAPDETDTESYLAYAGLSNPGNVCFMNAVLQLLFSCDGFFRSLEKYLAKAKIAQGCQLKPRNDEKENCAGEANGSKKDLAVCSLLLRVGDHLRSYNKCLGSNDAVEREFDASGLLAIISKQLHAPHYLSTEQQDAHEFLQYLLEAVEQEIGTACIPKAFGIQIKTTVACMKCDYKASQSDTRSHVSLSLPALESVTVQTKDRDNGSPASSTHSEAEYHLRELITAYLEPTTLEYNCDSCRGLEVVGDDAKQELSKTSSHTAQQIAELVSTQTFLLFHLNRFVMEAGTINKSSKRIILDKFLTVCGRRYSLRGVVKHTGKTVYSGHYTAYRARTTKNTQRQRGVPWLYCSDDYMNGLKEEVVLNSRDIQENAYLVLYRKT